MILFIGTLLKIEITHFFHKLHPFASINFFITFHFSLFTNDVAIITEKNNPIDHHLRNKDCFNP